MNRNSDAKNTNLFEISKLLTEISSKEAYEFLSEILTPTEFETISKRWQIIKMLNQDFSQREISKELNVSLCKVTRGAKILKKQNSVTKKIITKEL